MISRNLLPDYYLVGCACSVVLYTIMVTFFFSGSLSLSENNPLQDERHTEWGYDEQTGHKFMVSYDQDSIFKQLSMVSATTFAASAFQTMVKMVFVKVTSGNSRGP